MDGYGKNRRFMGKVVYGFKVLTHKRWRIVNQQFVVLPAIKVSVSYSCSSSFTSEE